MTSETNIYQLDQVNKLARKQRHVRVFSHGELFKKLCSKISSLFGSPVSKCKALPIFQYHVLPISPPKRFFSEMVIFSVLMFLMSTVTSIGNFTTVSMSYSSDYIDAYSLPGDILIADGDGYLMKINPQTSGGSRIGMTDYALHTVEKGETLSVIAGIYGLKVETIMWENDLINANSVRVGQKLVIPPVDGISYTTAKGDTLEKIAKKYGISVDAIIAQNNLGSDTIALDQHLFLPGAKQLAKPRTIASGRPGEATLSNSSSTPAADKSFIFPTKGVITQKYHAGHYALDIADSSKPPIWAAASGTVVKASSGTWGGGYGNHVIIDHGNGYKTLYGHMDHLTVTEGQYVEQGEVIGQMGNTGRVYGRTGIHLHWEVIKNGVKQDPRNFY